MDILLDVSVPVTTTRTSLQALKSEMGVLIAVLGQVQRNTTQQSHKEISNENHPDIF